MKVIKAVFFDFDGTLIDSEPIYHKGWNMVMEKLGLPIITEKDYYRNWVGNSFPVLFQRLKETYNLSHSLDTMVAWRNEIMKKIKTPEKEEYTFYAKESIEYFKNKNIPLSIVTANSKNAVLPIMEHKKLLPYFEHIITLDDVENSKPHPDCYLLAAKQMKYNTENYLVFEDSVGGVTAAKRANLCCFAICADKELHHKYPDADKIFLNLKDAIDFLNNSNEYQLNS